MTKVLLILYFEIVVPLLFKQLRYGFLLTFLLTGAKVNIIYAGANYLYFSYFTIPSILKVDSK